MFKICNVESKPTQYGAIYDTHMHDFFEILIFLTEGVTVIYGTDLYKTKVGDVFIFEPFSMHCVNINHKKYERLLLHFKDQQISKSAAVLNPIIQHLKDSPCKMVSLNNDELEIAKKLFFEAELLQQNETFFADFDIIFALGGILKFLIERFNNKPQNNTVKQKKDIEKILLYINENYDQDISIEDICEKFDMSKSKLWSIMKNTIGISAKEYITKVRLSYATSMLTSGVSVTETANLCGFNSYSHFIRTFTKSIGVSPYRYGKLNNK